MPSASRGDSLNTVFCSQPDCRNMARATPYPQGYLCRRCHQKVQDAAAPPTQRHSRPKSRHQRALERVQRQSEEAAEQRALSLQQRAAAQETQRPRHRIVHAKPAIKGKALKPPGPLADLPPMWWEFNG